MDTTFVFNFYDRPEGVIIAGLILCNIFDPFILMDFFADDSEERGKFG